MMQRTLFTPVKCELCRRQVDSETARRARRAWFPLVVCTDCVRQCSSEAETGAKAA